MANVLVNDLYLGDIADAIREKLDTEDTYKPSEMANAIDSISGGGSTPVINPLSVTENGTYTAQSGVDGYSPVTVNVPQGITPTGTKQISITENGTTTEDVTNYANAEITVNVSGGGTSQLTKIVEVTVAQDSRSISIPTDDWFDYDFLIFNYNLTFSGADYLYASKTDASGGIYSNGNVPAYAYVGEAYKKNSNMVVVMPEFAAAGISRIEISSGDSFYLYMYTSSKKIQANSTVTVYGGHKSDL